MRLFKLIVPGAAIVAMAGLPVLADGTGTTDETNGVDNAITRIEAATTRHIDVLTALLAKVPAQAQPGIQRAIDAAQDGHDKALAALNRHEAKEPSEPTATGPASSGTGSTGAAPVDTVGSKPDVTGLMRARDAVTAAFQKSVSTLQGLIAKVPSQAAASIQAALARVEEHRSVALQNLNNLIAGQKPGHPTAPDPPARADRPDRPDRPDRADRPTLPERPVRPEHPQVPVRP